MASLLWAPGWAQRPRADPSAPRSLRPALLCPQYNKHLFVHIGQSSPSYSDPYLEAVDIHQIYDKFPEKKGGLKELFERGPSNAFFLVKFWVSPSWPCPFLPQLVDDHHLALGSFAPRVKPDQGGLAGRRH